MHALYDLKEKLLEELEEYGKKELSASSLDKIDTLAHATKNICKVIEACEEEKYSSRGMSRRSYYYDSYDDGVEPGRSYRRDGMGRYMSRGYSRNGDMAEKLRELMQDAPDEHARSEIQRLVSKLENV